MDATCSLHTVYHRRAMTPEPNPYAPPAEAPRGDAPPEGEPLHQFTVAQPSRDGWNLAIHAEAIHLVHTGDKPARRVDRRGFAEHARIGFFGRKAALTLREPKPAVTIWLSPEALTALRAWLDPVLPQHLVKALAGQRVSAIFIAVIWALGAAPTGGRPADVLGIAFAATWLAWAAAATLKPHRALLLVAAALWVGVGASFGLQIVHGAGWWNLIFVVLVYPAVPNNLRSFRFYGPIERTTS